MKKNVNCHPQAPSRMAGKNPAVKLKALANVAAGH
jgi:hypothetical protein